VQGDPPAMYSGSTLHTKKGRTDELGEGREELFSMEGEKKREKSMKKEGMVRRT